MYLYMWLYIIYYYIFIWYICLCASWRNDGSDKRDRREELGYFYYKLYTLPTNYNSIVLLKSGFGLIVEVFCRLRTNTKNKKYNWYVKKREQVELYKMLS